LVAWVAAWLGGWLAGRLPGWLAGWLPGPPPRKPLIARKACTCRISKQWVCVKRYTCAFSQITRCTGAAFEASTVPQSTAGTSFEASSPVL